MAWALSTREMGYGYHMSGSQAVMPLPERSAAGDKGDGSRMRVKCREVAPR